MEDLKNITNETEKKSMGDLKVISNEMEKKLLIEIINENIENPTADEVNKYLKQIDELLYLQRENKLFNK